MADDPALAAQGAFHCQVRAGLDEPQVVPVGGGGPGEVARLLDHRLLRADAGRELLGEPRPGVDRVDLDVAEGVAADLLTGPLQLGHDRLHAGALGDEEGHAAGPVHDVAQARGLRLDVELPLGQVHAVHVPAVGVVAEAGQELLASDPAVVLQGGRRRQPTAPPAHHLVHHQHPRVGGVLGDHVAGEDGALLGGGPGPEGLPDGDDVVVHGLGQADHGELVVVAGEVGGQVGGGGVGVVPADRVQHVDAVGGELLGGDRQSVLTLLDQPAADQVRGVGQLDPAVAERAAAEPVQQVRVAADLRRHGDRPTRQQPGVPVEVADQLDLGGDLGVPLHEPADRGGQARGQPPGRQHGHLADRRGLGHAFLLLLVLRAGITLWRHRAGRGRMVDRRRRAV